MKLFPDVIFLDKRNKVNNNIIHHRKFEQYFFLYFFKSNKGETEKPMNISLAYEYR